MSSFIIYKLCNFWKNCLTFNTYHFHLLNERNLQNSEIWQESNEIMYKQYLADWDLHCLLDSPPFKLFFISCPSLYWKLRASQEGLYYNILHCRRTDRWWLTSVMPFSKVRDALCHPLNNLITFWDLSMHLRKSLVVRLSSLRKLWISFFAQGL